MPLPLFDAGAGVGTGSNVRSATAKVSVFVIEMLIAETVVATLIKWEGDAIGAVDWRPLSTIVGVIPLLVVASTFLW